MLQQAIKSFFIVWFLTLCSFAQGQGNVFESELAVSLTEEEQTWIAENSPIIVAAELDWAPFDYVDESGRHQGIARDYLKLVKEKTGLDFIVEINSWHKIIERFQEGKIDLLPAVYLTPERKRYMHFTSPYFRTLDYFFIRQDINASTMEDIAQLRVAIPKGYANIDYIRSQFPLMTIIEVDSLGAAIDAVVETKADLLYDTYAVIDFWLQRDGIKQIKPFLSSREQDKKYLYMATAKNLPLLNSIVQKGLDAISTEERQRINRRWMLAQPSGNSHTPFVLSAEEQQWLKQHPVIRFAGDPNWLPYEAFDDDGNYVGIVAEYLKLIEKKLNFSFERVPTKTWSETLFRVEQGEIDVISETSDSSLRKQLLFTQTYLSSPIVVVMADHESYVESIEEIKHKRVAMIQQYGYIDTIRNAHPDVNFVEVPSIQLGLTAVSTGKVDALIATLAQASYHISDLGINNVRIVGKTEFSTRLAFGVKKEHRPLVTMINRALADISLSEKQQILDNWGRYKFVSRVDYSLIIGLVVVFVIFAALILYWNRKLAREVSLRKDAEAQTKILLDNIPLQILVTNQKGDLLTVNPQVLSDHGMSSSELIGYNMRDFYENDEDRLAVLAELSKHNRVKNQIAGFRRLNGEVRQMMTSIVPIRYQNEPAYLAIALDVTERMRMELDLKEAKERAEVANRTKSDFLANMSHEIRTPMNAILGFTELLHRKVTDKKLLSYLDTIQSAGNDLLLLINDILDLSKIEAGKVELSKTPVNPHYLFDELKHIFQLSADKKGLNLLVEVDQEIPESVMLDLPRLRQVLVNLLGNAIKFTDQGYVRLHAKVAQKDSVGSKLDLCIEVEDTGKGIPENSVEIIFNAFQQVEGHHDYSIEGTGLGLSISHKLVALMGGYIGVESEVGKGSIFSVYLKDVDVASITNTTCSMDVGREGDEYHFEPGMVLVVDDIVDNRFLVRENLLGTGLDVVEAENGQQAVELVMKQKVDLILMDLRMPVLDGYQAAAEIKKNYSTPILALTASAMKDEFDRLKAENFEDYLHKPVKRGLLIEKIAKFLPHRVEATVQNSSELVLSETDLSRLPDVLDGLEPLRYQWRSIQDSNNISAIEKFGQELKSLSNQVGGFAPLDTYADELLQAIAVFDIATVTQSLLKFEVLCDQLAHQNNHVNIKGTAEL